MPLVFVDAAVAACDETLTVEPVRRIGVPLRQARLADGFLSLAVRFGGRCLKQFVAVVPRKGQSHEISPHPGAIDHIVRHQ